MPLADIRTIRKRIRVLLTLFIILLILGGLSAFLLVPLFSLLDRLSGDGKVLCDYFPTVAHWVSMIQQSLTETGEKNPFMFYATDWIGFAHIVMVIACIGPLREPIRNIWVIQFAMVGCILMIPMTLITGIFRGLPWFWQLFDCGIGMICAALLFSCYRYARQIETIASKPDKC